MFSIILNQIEQEFMEGLSRKTGWGKNEIASLYKETQVKVLSQFIDRIEEKNTEKKVK